MPISIPKAGEVVQADSSAVANAVSQRDANGDIAYRYVAASAHKPASASVGAYYGAVRSITASGTVAATDHVILADATGGAITVTLPAAATSGGMLLTIKKTDNANNVVADANASETIDGATTKTIATQYGFLTLACDATGWHIIASGGTIS